jgi:hypothetical protein
LQSDLRLSRDKLKRKQAILVRQEEEVAARDTALAAAQRGAQQLQVRVAWGPGPGRVCWRRRGGRGCSPAVAGLGNVVAL